MKHICRLCSTDRAELIAFWSIFQFETKIKKMGTPDHQNNFFLQLHTQHSSLNHVTIYHFHSLQWRHMNVTTFQITTRLSVRQLFGLKQSKHQLSSLLIHSHKGPTIQKVFPCHNASCTVNCHWTAVCKSRDSTRLTHNTHIIQLLKTSLEAGKGNSAGIENQRFKGTAGNYMRTVLLCLL